MNKDQLIGAGLLVGSVAGIVVYAYILFLTEYDSKVPMVGASGAIAGVLGILAWIGYTLATTPPPKPIEEIEKELEEELKTLEKESTNQENNL